MRIDAAETIIRYVFLFLFLCLWNLIGALLLRLSCKWVTRSALSYFASYRLLLAWSSLFLTLSLFTVIVVGSIDFYMLQRNVWVFQGIGAGASLAFLAYLVSRRLSVAFLKGCYVSLVYAALAGGLVAVVVLVLKKLI